MAWLKRCATPGTTSLLIGSAAGRSCSWYCVLGQAAAVGSGPTVLHISTVTCVHMAPGISQRHIFGSLYHTSSFRPPSLPLTSRIRGCVFSVMSVSPVYTRGLASGPAKPERKRSGSGGEHGSVLAEFVGREKEPKQLTVAGKGQ